ncbi:hypothetical protein TWF506_004112 [Arthrobotrys conoides]|uniref:Uncharacterized protein n=1 Tax=Arthrobotrys conoides TaxID=74498 RepID=A0AAN8N3N0_9PEZI
MSRVNRSSGRCTCCRDKPCFSEHRRDRGGHCPHCLLGSNNWQACPWEYCSGDCNGMCRPEGPHREPGRAWAENEIHRQQRNQNYPLTDFDNPDMTLRGDRNAMAGAERRLMRHDARLEGYYQGHTPRVPLHHRVPRQNSPPEDYYGDIGFARDIPRSEPRDIIYPPGGRHHLSRDYNNLQDPNPGRFGFSRAQPRNIHQFGPENYRPSMPEFESDWDPWPEYERQMRGGREYD